MNYEQNNGQKNFFLEMENHQISAQEFFCPFMLEALERNFGLDKVIIMYFDTHGHFLSMTDKDGQLNDDEGHLYLEHMDQDKVRKLIYDSAVSDHLTYFDTDPRLYRATDILSDYENSGYTGFLEKCFKAHYSLTMAFGINAYIQLLFLRSAEDGDFTDDDISYFRDIYSYIAMSYKNFKKYEQVRIISRIQGEIIASGEKAYLITDDFMHVLFHSDDAVKKLEELMGNGSVGNIDPDTPCSWLPFLLGMSDDDTSGVHNRTIKNYIYTIHDYPKIYSNGIVDMYHWITIHKKKVPDMTLEDNASVSTVATAYLKELTKTEHKVASFMAKGYTYKEIAAEMMISYHTVKKHVENIYEKCHVNSRYQLIKLFSKRNIG